MSRAAAHAALPWRRGDVVWFFLGDAQRVGRLVRVDGGYHYVRDSHQPKRVVELYDGEMSRRRS